MSLSSPYGQNTGDQSPLGGSSLFTDWGGQNQGGALGSGMFGSLTPAPPQATATNNLQPVTGAASTNNLQPVIGAAQEVPPGVTSGATNMMVTALANPAPAPANPASFAPQNAAPVAPAAPQAPANPLSFLGNATAPVAAPQNQNPYGF
jgi:hypothetical protein